MNLQQVVLGIMLCSLAVSMPAAAAASDDLTFSGYFDTSYNYLLNNHQFVSQINDREYDLTQNGITLQQATLTATKLPKSGLGGLLTVLVGRDAYSLAPYGWNPNEGSQMLGMTVVEGYVNYVNGPYTVQGGLFQTMIGYEGYDTNLNTNFSRSILDNYAEPGLFLGARTLYAWNDKLTLNLGISNGWSGIRDTGRGKTIDFGWKYQFNQLVALMLQGASGEQRLLTMTASGPLGRRNIFDLVAWFTLNEKLSFVLSGDYGTQTKALASSGNIQRVQWQGVAAYADYVLAEKWHTSLRGEWYVDQNGYTTGVRQHWQEATATVAYLPCKNVILRAETRRDFSNKPAFMSEVGPTLSHAQQSFALEGVYNW